MPKSKFQMKKILFIIAGLIGIFLVFFGIRVYSFVRELKNTHNAAGFIQHQSSGAGFTQARNTSSSSTAASPLSVPVDAPTIGSSNPLLQVQVFCDFQCPYCGTTFPVIRELVAKYADRIQLIFRHFPNEEAHPDAGRAAVASECAKLQGKFWPFHDKLFQNQDRLDMGSLHGYALSVGLDERSFTACLQDSQRRARVEQDLASALKLGVRGTPTWFINGKKVEGVLPLRVWEEILTKVPVGG